jgi:hypothetical protein
MIQMIQYRGQFLITVNEISDIFRDCEFIDRLKSPEELCSVRLSNNKILDLAGTRTPTPRPSSP